MPEEGEEEELMRGTARSDISVASSNSARSLSSVRSRQWSSSSALDEEEAEDSWRPPSRSAPREPGVAD
eukprot:2771323-Pyramimonas_sp.AAC.1